MKRRTIIHTGQSSNQRVQKDDEDVMVQDVYHVAVEEVNEDKLSEEDIKKAPRQLKDEGQATIDDLKELNLGISEESKLIFVNALCTIESR